MNEPVRIALDCFNGVELEEETVPGDGISQAEVHEARLDLLERLADESLGGRQAVVLPTIRLGDLPPAFRAPDTYAKLFVMVEKSSDAPLDKQQRMVGFSFRARRSQKGQDYSAIYMPSTFEAPRTFSNAVNRFADTLRLKYRPRSGKPTQQWIMPRKPC